jgi:phage RecT family recombinase
VTAAAPARATSTPARVDETTHLPALARELERRMDILRDSAASLVDPVKLRAVVLATFTRTPSLWDCDPVSIARAVVEAAQAGLEPTGSLGGAYLVPRWNGKTQQREAQLVIGYTGLVKLARRSGEVARVEARIVRACDEFDFGYGLAPWITHRPTLGLPEDAPNPMTHAYAVAHYRDGSVQFDVMSAAEILAIKARSTSKDRDGNVVGPWVTDEAEMWRKTVTRRLAKYLPLTVEAQRALDAEEAIAPEPVPAGTRRAALPGRIAARIVGTPPLADAPALASGDGPPPPPVAEVASGADEPRRCGSPSPYGDGGTCILPDGHRQRRMCTDGSATWERPTP